MTRLFAILIAVGFLSVSQAENSYADSDHDDDKYEQKDERHGGDKYEKKHDDERQNNKRDSRNSNPVSQSLDAVSNSVNKAANKINQAKEWWQFW